MKSVLKKIMWTAIAAVAIFITALIIRVIWEQRQLDAGSKRINAVIEQVSRVHHEEHMQKSADTATARCLPTLRP